MKASSLCILAMAAAALVTACGVSPETTITCTTVDSVTATFGTGGGVVLQRVRKGVLIEDPGLVQTTPGRDLDVDLTTNQHPDLTVARVCVGSAADCPLAGGANYATDVSTKTDENGILEYYLRLEIAGGGASVSNEVTEMVGGGAATCKTDYTISSS